MGKISDIESNLPHEVAELVCLKCLHRWIGVYPEKTLLKDLECKCGAVGYVIKTGQTIEASEGEEEQLKKLKADLDYAKFRCSLENIK